jgi:hypothetical protein
MNGRRRVGGGDKTRPGEARRARIEKKDRI